MLPLYLLTNSKGQTLYVELKSHEKIQGILDKVDSWMNLTLKNVKLEQFGEVHDIPEVYIKGRFIKSMSLPDEIIETVKAASNNKNNISQSNNRDNSGRRSHYNNNNNYQNQHQHQHQHQNNNGNYRRRNYNNNNTNNNNYLNHNNYNGRQPRGYNNNNQHSNSHNNHNSSNYNNSNGVHNSNNGFSNRQPAGGYAEFHQPISQIEQSAHLKL